MKSAVAVNEIPTRALPAPPTREAACEHALRIVVIFTEVKPTLEALRTAASLTQGLDALIHVIVPQVVPYPLPLDRPAVSRDFTERRFRYLLTDSSIPTRVEVCLCREESAILNALAPKSLVVIGVRSRWWPWSDRRLARMLRGRGHQVVLAERKHKSHA